MLQDNFQLKRTRGDAITALNLPVRVQLPEPEVVAPFLGIVAVTGCLDESTPSFLSLCRFGGSFAVMFWMQLE